MPETEQASGAGSLSRGVAVLRFLATSGPEGAALTDVARGLGIPYSTAHRVLGQLRSQRLTRQLEEGKRHALGPLAFELGLAAAEQFDVRSLFRPPLVELAQKAGDTAYIVLKAGDEAVCLDRQEGPTRIRVVSLDIGSRRPLGVGAGGLALLAALPRDVRAATIERITDSLARDWNTPEDQLLELVRRVNNNGYTLIQNRVTPGVSAIGQPIHDALGRPVAAISIAAINSQMTRTRAAVITKLLAESVRKLEARIQEAGWISLEP